MGLRTRVSDCLFFLTNSIFIKISKDLGVGRVSVG